MKNRLISIVSNGLPWGLVFFAVAFAVGYYGYNMPAKQIGWEAAAAGLCGLLINGITYSRSTKSHKQLTTITIELPPSETIQMEAFANHLTEDSLVAGKLFLTNQRLVFKPHGAYKLPQPAFSWEQPLFSWDLNDIELYKFYGSIWNAGGEFLVNTKEQSSLMFEVDRLKQWKAALTNAKQNSRLQVN